MTHIYWARALSVLALFVLPFTGTAEAAAKFESAAVPGSPKMNPAFFRIEVATGRVVTVWGAGSTPFLTTAEPAPLPAGDYHLTATNAEQPDGTVYWELVRMESGSGRTWTLTGGGTAPFAWVEVAEPK
jgi:hypothetical protein